APFPVFGEQRMQRDFTYIDDIVEGGVAALDRPPADDGAPKPGGSGAPHALYNLGNSRPEPLSGLIAALEKACGRAAIRQPMPMQPGDVPRTYADIEASRRDLGFAPRTSLEDGIARFVEWYRGYSP